MSREFTCVRCGKSYTYHGHDVKKYKKANIHICNSCKDELPGEGMYTLTCRECGEIFNSTMTKTPLCPSCSEKRRTFICEICDEEYVYSGDNLKYYMDNDVRVCDCCKGGIPGEGDYVLRCSLCEELFRGIWVSAKQCPDCTKTNYILTCEICGNEYSIDRLRTRNGVKICSECKDRLPGEGSNVLRCKSCNKIFLGNNGRGVICPDCKEFTCGICGKRRECDKWASNYGICCATKICWICRKKDLNSNEHVFRCEHCGDVFYVESNTSTPPTLCPICEIRKTHCDICGIEYIVAKGCDVNRMIKACEKCFENITGDGKYVFRCGKCKNIFRDDSEDATMCSSCIDLIKSRRKITCTICGETFIRKVYCRKAICPECKENLPGKGKCILTCKGCGGIFRGISSGVTICPSCDERNRTLTCLLCGNIYIAEKGTRIDRVNTPICPDCDNDLPGEGRNILTCQRCGCLFKGNGGRCRTCPVCLNTIPKSVSVERYEKLIESGWKEDEKNGVIIKGIPEEKKGETECITCHRKFKRLNSKQLFCKHCCHVFTCVCCGRRFAVKYVKFGYKPQYCSCKCANSSRKDIIKPREININDIDVDIDISQVVSETKALGVEIGNSMTKPGVWGLYDENGILLDVHQTINVAFEWRNMQKFTRSNFTLMRNDGIDLTKVSGKVIVFDGDLTRRLMVEESFAIKYGAKYWHPQPYTFQMKIISRSITRNGDS